MLVMDNPGRSLYFGGSIHVDGIRAPDQDEEEEDEEENRKREAEIQGMLANAFDDLEEDESFAQQSGYNSFAFGKERRDSAYYEDGGAGKKHSDASYRNYDIGDGHGDNVFDRFGSESQDKRVEFAQRESYSESFDVQGHQGHGILNGDHASHANSSGSVTPWSDDSHDDESSERFTPLAYHETAHDPYHITAHDEHTGLDLDHNDYRPDVHKDYGESSLVYADQANDYQADKYRSLVNRETQEKVTEAEYRAADTPQDQMKLLYEARGRELDRLSSELSKLKFESSRDIRVLQHQINLVTSDGESKTANISQLQTLLSEKEERIKSMAVDLKELQIKLNDKENENKKLHFELETAQSTISSLECQISELKAADTLTRNQKLHEDFVTKLKQGNEEEREMLLSKLQGTQNQAEQHEKEVTRLREELRSLRATYDESLVQKTETVTKLTVTNETLRKQYEDLMKSHDGQQIIELQIKVRSLEATKDKLENQVCSLESELAKAKEEIDGFDTAMKLGILSEVIPGEDSMVQLGIKRALNYDDTILGGERQAGGEKHTEAQEKLKLKDELKRSLMSNKAKRDEISRMQEEASGKQLHIKKLESELKSAQTEIKELKSSLLKMELAQAEKQQKEKQGTENEDGQPTALCAENVGLREELILLHGSLRELEESFVAFKDVVENWQQNLPSLTQEKYGECMRQFDKLVTLADLCCNSVKDMKHYHDTISKVRDENNNMQKKQALWEKQVDNVQIKMKVFEKMIVSAKSDLANGSEYEHVVNVIERLLRDFIEQTQFVKQDVRTFHSTELCLKDELTKAKLKVAQLQRTINNLKNERDMHKKNVDVLAEEKEREKKEALEDCQDTYMRFHEEAMKELETKMRKEYENISNILKKEVARLADELSDTKKMYIGVCEEKKELEDQLKVKTDDKTEPSTTPVMQSNTYRISPHDSGVDINSCQKTASVPRDPLQHTKQIQDLQAEIANLKEASKQESERMDLLKESFQIQFEQRLKVEKEAARQEVLKSLETLQKKCSTLEECNQILKDSCTSLEEELQNVKETNNNSETCSKEIENCRYILERQRKQFEKQEEELRTQHEKEIGDFKNLLAATKTKNLQESGTVAEYRKKLAEQDKEIQSFMEELVRMKGKLEAKEAESEQEVQRMTDIILNLESEVKEQQEEKNFTRANFQKMIQDLQNDHVLVKQSLKISEDRLSEYKDLDSKYKSMKQKYAKFQASSKEQITHYKSELKRLSTEYDKAKETLLQRVQSFIEEIKGKCAMYIDSTVLTLQNIDSAKYPVGNIISQLQAFSRELKSFSLQLT